jgi:hypothetical protein
MQGCRDGATIQNRELQPPWRSPARQNIDPLVYATNYLRPVILRQPVNSLQFFHSSYYSPIMAHPDGVQTNEGRLATFSASQPAKRRASATRKRAAATLTWPHQSPNAEDVS